MSIERIIDFDNHRSACTKDEERYIIDGAKSKYFLKTDSNERKMLNDECNRIIVEYKRMIVKGKDNSRQLKDLESVNEPAIKYVLENFDGKGLSAEDISSAVKVGLIKAIDIYDKEESFAELAIKTITEELCSEGVSLKKEKIDELYMNQVKKDLRKEKIISELSKALSDYTKY